MEADGVLTRTNILSAPYRFIRKCVFCVLSAGVVPEHIAFIMDGNRRYMKNKKLAEGAGHDAGFSALMTMLLYCHELGVKYVTAYAFSIDNFKRNPEEVRLLMDLMREKIEFLTGNVRFLNQHQMRVHFSGNLDLFDANLSDAMKRLMAATACNSKLVLTICVAYTSTNEIAHALEASCQEKHNQIQIQEASDTGSLCKDGNHIKVLDVEKHMYMAVAPDPDIVVRTSGENRLSNFLLWQSSWSYLYTTSTLWPAIGLWDLISAVVNFQRCWCYLEKKKKQL